MAHPNPNCKPDCFGCKASSISFAPSAMATRSLAAGYKATEKQQEKDLPAYKRLREDGLQPKSTKGAAEIEAQATTRFEVTSGQIFRAEDKSTLKAALTEYAPDLT